MYFYILCSTFFICKYGIINSTNTIYNIYNYFAQNKTKYIINNNEIKELYKIINKQSNNILNLELKINKILNNNNNKDIYNNKL